MNSEIQTINNNESPLINNNNVINTASNQDENANLDNIDNNHLNVGSQEKILHLQRGYKIWYRICTVFGISLVCFITSIAVAAAAEFPLLFILTGISAIGIIYTIVMLTCCNGFITISPNEAVVYQYYGRYLGTVKDNGYFYGYPLATHQTVSLRSNQYNGNRLKVNERDGTPVELGIIVVWKIGDTAKAVFDVVNYKEFIEAQSEAAIRYIGCKYPYEPTKPGEISLRGGHEIINKELREELEKRIKPSGIIIEDARITEIALGSEVAQMILQKQASNATSSAKDTIVKGATNSIINSINEFERNGMHLSEEDKGKFIISMMNTLCMSSDVSKIMPNQ